MTGLGITDVAQTDELLANAEQRVAGYRVTVKLPIFLAWWCATVPRTVAHSSISNTITQISN